MNVYNYIFARILGLIHCIFCVFLHYERKNCKKSKLKVLFFDPLIFLKTYYWWHIQTCVTITTSNQQVINSESRRLIRCLTKFFSLNNDWYRLFKPHCHHYQDAAVKFPILVSSYVASTMILIFFLQIHFVH